MTTACGYVIQRKEDGAFVARRGSEHSYTRRLQNARVFIWHDDALQEACGNERVLSLAEVLYWEDPK